ncbi:MAG: hypothetical protein J6H18_00140 [Lachnospiraceae bacterium]|nr:hypothetical protein [Lachnospiraceae bacterium]
MNEKLKRALIHLGIGIGLYILARKGFSAEDSQWKGVILGIVLFGLPAGWSFIGRHLGHTFYIGGLQSTLLFYGLKICIGSLIGWCVLPVELFAGLLNIRRDKLFSVRGRRS